MTTTENEQQQVQDNKKKKKKEKVWNTSLFPAKVFPSANVQLSPSEQNKEIIPQLYLQTVAGLTGIVTGLSVAGFKLSIDAIRKYFYGDFLIDTSPEVPYYLLIPSVGAVVVAILMVFGEFSPGLRGVVNEVDDCTISSFVDSSDNNSKAAFDPLKSIRKTIAATFTLGTGNSLGPEGPSVELGVAVSRLLMSIWPYSSENTNNANKKQVEGGIDIVERIQRDRLLLGCGAAAGVSSGFNAPLSGVFFALEVVQATLPSTLSIPTMPPSIPADNTSTENTTDEVISSGAFPSEQMSSPLSVELQQQSFSADPGSIACILTSSVLSALVSRILLGNELALELVTYEIQTPFLELPLYLLLGTLAGLVAVLFSQTAKTVKSTFDGNVGPTWVRDSVQQIPTPIQPFFGSITCGIIGYFYPQVFFFGYDTLNYLLESNELSTDLLLSLLTAKLLTTAIAAGSGLVGGILAPTLFLGGMLGSSYHNIVQETATMLSNNNAINVDQSLLTLVGGFELADVPAYAMVGAASVLGAVFRAPLTASLILFEITRNYDVLLPLLASTGLASLVCDIVESKVEASK